MENSVLGDFDLRAEHDKIELTGPSVKKLVP